MEGNREEVPKFVSFQSAGKKAMKAPSSDALMKARKLFDSIEKEFEDQKTSPQLQIETKKHSKAEEKRMPTKAEGNSSSH